MRNSIKLLAILALVLFGGDLFAQNRFEFKFNSAASLKPWQAVNDGVMGGRSDGRFRLNGEQRLEFYGNLSLANNGGFASIRARGSSFGLQPGDEVVLLVRGDGREYNFNLYTQSNFGGYSFRQSFRTIKDKWVEVRLPVENFVATWRGRVYSDQKLDLSKVNGFGILLGDKRPGAFKLEVDSILGRPKSSQKESSSSSLSSDG